MTTMAAPQRRPGHQLQHAHRRYPAQTITVDGPLHGTNAETGVERINFNGATFDGYLLGADDYLISRLDPNNRDGGGVNLSASIANNFIVGEQGINDDITGGSGNDLIFGGTGDNDLVGGLGDDLLVGGTGDDDSTTASMRPATTSKARSAPTPWSAAPATTPTASTICSTWWWRPPASGTDTVETFMAALSLEIMANVENLAYTGVDADQFVGTGNA